MASNNKTPCAGGMIASSARMFGVARVADPEAKRQESSTPAPFATAITTPAQSVSIWIPRPNWYSRERIPPNASHAAPAMSIMPVNVATPRRRVIRICRASQVNASAAIVAGNSFNSVPTAAVAPPMTGRPPNQMRLAANATAMGAQSYLFARNG